MSAPADVLVVGAGPTGLTLVAQLDAFGIKTRIVDRQDQPRRDRQPVRDTRHEDLGHPIGIEARVDGPKRLGKHVHPRQRAPQRGLEGLEPVGEIRSAPGQTSPACRTTGARLPTSPGQSALRPIWNGGSF